MTNLWFMYAVVCFTTTAAITSNTPLNYDTNLIKNDDIFWKKVSSYERKMNLWYSAPLIWVPCITSELIWVPCVISAGFKHRENICQNGL